MAYQNIATYVHTSQPLAHGPETLRSSLCACTNGEAPVCLVPFSHVQQAASKKKRREWFLRRELRKGMVCR